MSGPSAGGSAGTASGGSTGAHGGSAGTASAPRGGSGGSHSGTTSANGSSSGCSCRIGGANLGAGARGGRAVGGLALFAVIALARRRRRAPQPSRASSARSTPRAPVEQERPGYLLPGQLDASPGQAESKSPGGLSRACAELGFLHRVSPRTWREPFRPAGGSIKS